MPEPVLEVIPTGAALGAEVRRVDLARELPDAVMASIRQAFDRHAVLRFRDQRLTVEQLLAFGRRLGPLDPTEPGAYGGRHDLARYPDLMIVSNVVEDGVAVGALGDGELKWHSDMSNWRVPPWATMLYAVEVPEQGGDTSFASMYAALAELTTAQRARISGRNAWSDGTLDARGKPIPNPVSAEHPLIARHPFSGRDLLYPGRRWNGYVVGMPRAESNVLLDELWALATEPRFVWTQSWRRGDLILWDNLATLHQRSTFDPHARRVLWRLQLTGRPIPEA
ncbi:MAG: TauD/TfdA family dioxygenase [Alphaproteobacteria bacterium]|nr:TauD/TfdA family dioxygenase [Alphaproteobacteria bacterium]